MDPIIFVQKFPFTEKARNYLKESNISLEDVSEEHIKKAVFLISRANSGKNYLLDIVSPTKEVLEKEIIAFPISKLIISSINIPNINEKFAELFRKKTFDELLKENTLDIMFLLADDFKINYDLDNKNNIIIPLLQYLNIYFIDEETKLVNKRVEKGKVFLNNNDFARFLAEKVFQKILDSLPIAKENIPKKFVQMSKSLSPQLAKLEQKNYAQRISGKIIPELFPYSMQQLYEKQLAGEKLSYYERLSIGGFLQQIGMQKNDMLAFFSKSPDYKKHLAEYHINRIYDVQLSAPSYRKMDEYGIMVSQEEKKFSHPLRYYLMKLRQHNRTKNLKEVN
jgi:hypothetical protein